MDHQPAAPLGSSSTWAVDAAMEDEGSCTSSPRAAHQLPPDLLDVDTDSEASTETGMDCSDFEAEGDFLESELTSTLIVFDWDDTLLPLTFLRQQGLHNADFRLGGEQQLRLDSAARCIARTLKLAKQLGEVIIVTNAEAGWVEATACFLPALAPLLEQVPVVSARTAFEHRAPGAPPEWKRMAFEQEVGVFCRQLPPGSVANVVSLGDDAAERDALFGTVEVAPDCRGKAIKLLERPSLEQLVRQHGLIQECLAGVVGHEGNLEMSVERAAGVG